MRHVGRGVREQIREGRRPRYDNGMQFILADKIRRDVGGERLRGWQAVNFYEFTPIQILMNCIDFQMFHGNDSFVIDDEPLPPLPEPGNIE